ncbi:MAG: CBS domain-containing protein [Acidimicrobiia bacterium]
MAKLAELMSSKVFSVAPGDTLTEAAKAMVKGRVGSAMVVDGKWLLGILTERDALRAAAAGAEPTVAKVKDWMTSDPVTATPDTDVEEAAGMMAAGGFRHLPVVDGGGVVGVVSLRDLLSTRIRKPS